MKPSLFRSGQTVEIVGIGASNTKGGGALSALNGARFVLFGYPTIGSKGRWYWEVSEAIRERVRAIGIFSEDVTVAEECLRPVYDGNEKVSWEDCAWKPKTLPEFPKDRYAQFARDQYSRLVFKSGPSTPGPEETKDLFPVFVESFVEEFIRATSTAYPRPPELATPEKIRRGR